MVQVSANSAPRGPVAVARCETAAAVIRRAVLVGAALTIFWSPSGAGAPDADRQAELIWLLRHDCGSCHGLNLTGGLGPSLSRETLSSKEETMLEATVIRGRPGTPMPPWGSLLTQDEVRWLVRYLKEGRR